MFPRARAGARIQVVLIFWEAALFTSESFLATYEDGVLKPHQPLALAPHSQVRVLVEPLDAAASLINQKTAWQNVKQLWATSSIDSAGERLTRDQLHDRR
jgi:predicted DNA-binding antitoxin AbrB/MazE fold protein